MKLLLLFLVLGIAAAHAEPPLDRYKSTLDYLRTIIDVVELQLAQAQMAQTLLENTEARTSCVEAKRQHDTASELIERWKQLPSESLGRRKSEYINEYNALLPRFRDLQTKVDECLSRTPDKDPNPTPRDSDSGAGATP